MRDWPSTEHRFADSLQSVSEDELDEAAEAAQRTPDAPGVPGAMRAALRRAQAPLTRRSIALALAASSGPDDCDTADVLREAYLARESEPFEGPALLQALGLFALRSDVARADVLGRLGRLGDPTAPHPDRRYLLVAAAKVLGWLDAARTEPAVRRILARLEGSSDLAVQAEARLQVAFVTLADAFLAADFGSLAAALAQARVAFLRSEACEEHRPDATVFAQLLEMIAVLADNSLEPAAALDRVSVAAGIVSNVLSRQQSQTWQGYGSGASDLLFGRVHQVVLSLLRAARSRSGAAMWINLDRATIDLAASVAVVRGCADGIPDVRVEGVLRSVAERIMPPALGPCLRQAVGLARLDLIIERAQGSTEEVRAALESLRLAARNAPEVLDRLPVEVVGGLQKAAGLVGREPAELLREFWTAISIGEAPTWLDALGIAPAPLPIDRPGLFGSDPAVDSVVRRLLVELRTRLVRYDARRWSDLVLAIESVVAFVRHVRDEMPIYTRCEEDKGLGQKASEDDLQTDLRHWLAMRFGSGALYEQPGVGGGRPDNGIQLSSAQFPIEVKAEFISIERTRLHSSFVAQVDGYAASRDRVAFLLLLDLRDQNARGHRQRVAAARKGKTESAAVSTYSLGESFWVGGLDPDPQIANASPNAVIVALVLGNRPLPSSMTDYSERPRSSGTG